MIRIYNYICMHCAHMYAYICIYELYINLYIYLYTIHIHDYLTTNTKQQKTISLPRINKFYIRS